MADHQWHVARDKKKSGPFTSAQLRQMAADGRLLPTDMILKAGSQKWVPAKDVKGLFAQAASTAPPPPPPLPQASAAGSDETTPAPASTRRRPGIPIWAWATGGGVALVVVVVVLVLVVFLGGKPTNTGSSSAVASDGKDRQTPGDKAKSTRDRGPAAEFFAPKVEYAKGPKGQPLKEYKEVQEGKPVVFTAFVIDNGNRIPHGKFARFDPSGKRKLSETWYFDGKAHGPYIAWHPNGKLSKQGGHKEGFRHGLYKEWYDSGELSYQYSFVDGERHGTFTDWSEDGKCVTEVHFIKDVPQPFDLAKATRQQFEAAVGIASDDQGGTDREPTYVYEKRPDCDADDWFFRVFGRPVSGYTRLNVGSTQNWIYRCSDGQVVLRVRTTQGVIIILKSTTK